MNRDGVLEAVARARAEGAAERDPVGFSVIEAMARRAVRHHGRTQAWLLQRLQERLAGLPPAGAVQPQPGEHEPLAALTGLVQALGRAAPREARPRPTVPPPPLKAAVAFKGTWSRLRAHQRLRQATDQVPPQAGPLNSSSLVNRMLQTMHDVSPEYLEAFMAHVDALMALEQASGGGLPARPPRKP